MNKILIKYLPERAVEPCFVLIEETGVHLKIVNERVTRHGDYRRLPNGRHQVTINATLNKYRFLITLIHEIAHLVAFEKYGRRIKPHGAEWKRTFQYLMLPYIRPEIFPTQLLPLLASHFRNPKASSMQDCLLPYNSSIYNIPIKPTFFKYLPEVLFVFTMENYLRRVRNG